MHELLAYLRANGFKTFIVSGGGIEFMRPGPRRVYGMPPEQVVGSSIKTKYEVREAASRCWCDCRRSTSSTTRPASRSASTQHIGRRPIAAFGNSDGDSADARMDARAAAARG